MWHTRRKQSLGDLDLSAEARELELSECSLEGPIPTSIRELIADKRADRGDNSKGLLRVFLHLNHLSGELPLCLLRMRALAEEKRWFNGRLPAGSHEVRLGNGNGNITWSLLT